jgi:hypothetical protein
MTRPAVAPPRLLALLCCTGLATVAGAAERPSLAGLRPEHPRLLLTVEREHELRRLLASDPRCAELLAVLRAGADEALREPVVSHRLVGPRLLGESRACLAKVATLALAHRLTGEERYAERAWRELAAAAAFPDWNPAHFLDTAELCAAFGLGYDWLHDWLGPQRREILRRAIVTKGLEPGRTPAALAAAAKQNNWNPVCHGGLLLAALAIAEVEPNWAEELIPRVFANLPSALRHYEPDGAWYEGPGYWKYGTTYLAMLLDALHTALGQEGGLGATPGLARTGDFFRDALGPTDHLFNYADARTLPGTSPTLFWLAHRYGRPELADFEHHLLQRFLGQLRARRAAGDLAANQAVKLGDVETSDVLYSNRFLALELAWYHPGTAAGPTTATRSSFYRGVAEVAFLRGGQGPEASFAGFKGAGLPNAHAHLDAGSFVYDALGVRWAEDLGPDDYDLPGYWEMADEGRRWRYFRLGALSHNVVTINGRNQRAGIRAPITAYHADDERAHARADLSAAYAGQAAAVQRGLALCQGRALLVQDEVTGLAPGDEMRWAMLTAATVEIAGDTAILRLQGREMRARLLAPAGARWAVEPTRPPTAEENQNAGTRLLTTRLPLSPGRPTTLAVWLEPAAAPVTPPPLEPLVRWQDSRPRPADSP